MASQAKDDEDDQGGTGQGSTAATGTTVPSGRALGEPPGGTPGRPTGQPADRPPDATPQQRGTRPQPPTGGAPRPPSRRAVLWLAGGATALVAGSTLLWAYGPGGHFTKEAVQLRALKADPMGATTLLGLQALETDETSLPGLVTVERVAMSITRWFRDEHTSAQDLMDRLTAYAEQHGWTRKPSSTSVTTWIAHRTDPTTGDRMSLLVSTPETSPDEPRYNTVRVSLSF